MNIAEESCGHLTLKVFFSDCRINVLILEKLENTNVVKGKKMRQYFTPKESLNILSFWGCKFFTLLRSYRVLYRAILYSYFFTVTCGYYRFLQRYFVLVVVYFIV